jgi:hypothetical protein
MLCCAVLWDLFSLAKLPPGTVVLKDDTLYLPKSNRKDNNIINMLAKAIPNIEQAEWTTPKRAEEVVPGTGVKVRAVWGQEGAGCRQHHQHVGKGNCQY